MVLSVLLLFFVIEVLESSLGFLSSLYFYNHEYKVSLLFGLVFLFLLQVVLLFHWVVHEFHCIKLFDVVCFLLTQTFLRSFVNLFQSDFISKS